jgi:hypothetical protein
MSLDLLSKRSFLFITIFFFQIPLVSITNYSITGDAISELNYRSEKEETDRQGSLQFLAGSMATI